MNELTTKIKYNPLRAPGCKPVSRHLMKLFTKTFGCQMNFADSDEMGRHLKERGFTPTESEAEADAFLVNTCTVRDLAEHKAFSFVGRLRDWKLAHPHGLVIVTGCAAERATSEFKRKFPYIDMIVGAKDIEKFPQSLDLFLQRNGVDEENLLEPARGGETSGAEVKRVWSSERWSEGSLPAAGPISSYVTIMRGCNYNCTYCIVPSVRGREIYRSVTDIVKDTEARVAEGAKEIWLLGQTVNSYPNFGSLLREVDKVAGLERLRFISPHPYYLSADLIQAMADCRTVCEHIHLPVQSGSNPILKRMKRNYTRESYLNGIRNLRAAIPDVAISTDLIVGFPGETQADFKETLSLVEEANFDSAYCFKYSPRPGTASAEWEDDISDQEKEDRVNQLLAIVDNKGTEKVKRLIGTTQEVLIENDKGGGLVRGKTRTAWRVRLQDSSLKPGDLIQARITATHSRELHGERLILSTL